MLARIEYRKHRPCRTDHSISFTKLTNAALNSLDIEPIDGYRVSYEQAEKFILGDQMHRDVVRRIPEPKY